MVFLSCDPVDNTTPSHSITSVHIQPLHPTAPPQPFHQHNPLSHCQPLTTTTTNTVLKIQPSLQLAPTPTNRMERRLRSQLLKIQRNAAVKRLYMRLLRIKAGAGKIEREAAGIVSERARGPTGRCELPGEMKERMTMSGLHEKDLNWCWRDQELVATLTKIRLRFVNETVLRLRQEYKTMIRQASEMMTRQVINQTLQDNDVMAKKMWKEDCAKMDKKIEFIKNKAENCDKHDMCRRLNNVSKEFANDGDKNNIVNTNNDNPPHPKTQSPIHPPPTSPPSQTPLHHHHNPIPQHHHHHQCPHNLTNPQENSPIPCAQENWIKIKS